MWVNGDDGCVRGVELLSGEGVGELRGGHGVGVKIRAVWGGWVNVGGDGGGGNREEWVVSGGFDKRVFVWRAG